MTQHTASSRSFQIAEALVADLARDEDRWTVTRRKFGRLFVSMHDNAFGIPQAELEELFDDSENE